MKLRNKKTGEIADLDHKGLMRSNQRGDIVIWKNDANDFIEYKSLAELNEEWEDYEEDELFYVISAEFKSGYECVFKEEYPEICKVAKELGISFETEEEAKRAVEKLKAWKRLKDKQFKFYRWNKGSLSKNMPNNIEFACDDTKIWAWEDIQKDLDLLFGGEE